MTGGHAICCAQRITSFSAHNTAAFTLDICVAELWLKLIIATRYHYSSWHTPLPSKTLSIVHMPALALQASGHNSGNNNDIQWNDIT